MIASVFSKDFHGFHEFPLIALFDFSWFALVYVSMSVGFPLVFKLAWSQKKNRHHFCVTIATACSDFDNRKCYGEVFVKMVGRPGPVPNSNWEIFIDFVLGPSAVIFAVASWHWPHGIGIMGLFEASGSPPVLILLSCLTQRLILSSV